MVTGSLYLTSLLLVEERLLEADYFARALARQKHVDRLGYRLNAFLSAARSVTFLLQKEMARVPGFPEWWTIQRSQLAADSAAAFFLKLRNFSQKEGRVSVIGGSTDRGRWSYRFAGNRDPVPPALLHRDVSDCCREHVAKLASLVLAFAESFPPYSCPRKALTRSGMRTLGLSLDSLDQVLGLPRGWTASGSSLDSDRRLEFLRKSVDGVDFLALKRLTKWKQRTAALPNSASSMLSEQLLTSLVVRLERRRHGTALPGAVGDLILRRMSEEHGEGR